eukprot:TRINITY_DN6096_c0_g1_i1.p1 TRINITY_DN6096_c0_g1~~TRINITY_DN6096_c0_g1_i1.p1  ORF type:complete len:242 (+),score=33.53 TRINITY_DN6096_c0_g1_i1:107-832(+)
MGMTGSQKADLQFDSEIRKGLSLNPKLFRDEGNQRVSQRSILTKLKTEDSTSSFLSKNYLKNWRTKKFHYTPLKPLRISEQKEDLGRGVKNTKNLKSGTKKYEETKALVPTETALLPGTRCKSRRTKTELLEDKIGMGQKSNGENKLRVLVDMTRQRQSRMSFLLSKYNLVLNINHNIVNPKLCEQKFDKLFTEMKTLRESKGTKTERLHKRSCMLIVANVMLQLLSWLSLIHICRCRRAI